MVGFDPSLRNWGICIAELDVVTKELSVNYVATTSPLITDNKSVRVNSKDLESASQLALAVLEAVQGAHAVFVEVPVGSQSAQLGRTIQ